MYVCASVCVYIYMYMYACLLFASTVFRRVVACARRVMVQATHCEAEVELPPAETTQPEEALRVV